MKLKIFKYFLLVSFFLACIQNVPTADRIKLEYIGADFLYDKTLEHTYHISKFRITNANTQSVYFDGYSDSLIIFKSQFLSDTGWVYDNKFICGFGVYPRELPSGASILCDYFKSEDTIQRIEFSFYDKQENLLFSKYSEPINLYEKAKTKKQ